MILFQYKHERIKNVLCNNATRESNAHEQSILLNIEIMLYAMGLYFTFKFTLQLYQ